MFKLKIACGIALIGSLSLMSCKKVEGPGGTSAITGNLSAYTLLSASGDEAEYEITTVVCTHADGIDGSILDNSDYFLLNTPNNGTNYYVWYENTNWLGQDPGLSGRTAIKVTYSNSQSNVTIANNTAAAISAIAGADFQVEVQGDILTIINTEVGEVVDADDINTPFSIDTANQGKSAFGGSVTLSPTTTAVVDERVYLVYGDEDYYSESVRTDENGNFQFKGLTKGDYRIYAFSIDTLSSSGQLKRVQVSTEIIKNREVVLAPNIVIIN